MKGAQTWACGRVGDGEGSGAVWEAQRARWLIGLGHGAQRALPPCGSGSLSLGHVGQEAPWLREMLPTPGFCAPQPCLKLPLETKESGNSLIWGCRGSNDDGGPAYAPSCLERN